MNTALESILKQKNDDYRVRKLGKEGQITVISLDGIADDKLVSEFVVEPITNNGIDCTSLDGLEKCVITLVKCDKLMSLPSMNQALFNGHALVFIEQDKCLAFDTRTSLGRSISEPPTSHVTKGPREGFVESIKNNITLLRKRLKTSDLSITYISVGKYTSTAIAVCHINGVCQSERVQKILQQIQSITIDGVIDSAYIARYLSGKHTSLFKMVGNSEKPDIVAAKLLEGRVAVVVDGSPLVLTLPYLFMEDMQSPEDYYDSPQIATMARILRATSAIFSILLPSLYVSLQLFNYQIIPVKFLITILNATQNIPFNPLTEMIVVLVTFDILREANARMPTIAGLSLSIIGAVVLGDAAVKAGLLGAPAVMIGALSGIGLYTLPDNTLLLSLFRLLLTVIGGIMGLFGLILSLVALLAYLVSLSSHGAPYFAPFAPNIPHDKQDALLKKSLPTLIRRPYSIAAKNLTRQSNGKSNTFEKRGKNS